MGCSSAQEKIKKQISILNKEKNEIKKEREEYLKKLEIIEGCKITRTPIPDFTNTNKTNLKINNKKYIKDEIIVKNNHHHHNHHHYKKN